METTLGKSASTQWREYVTKGGTLGFKPWINREKAKMSADGFNSGLLLVDRTLNDSVHTAINDATTSGGLKTESTGKTVLGIPKPIFIVSVIGLLAGATYLIIQTANK